MNTYETIGLFAPIILFLFTMLFLRNYSIHLFVFFIVFILNYFLNIILKLTIKEPRPSKNIVNENSYDFDQYGMPSAHAQSCAYCLLFVLLTINNVYINALYLFIFVSTLFQRYLHNKHSLLQLFVGTVIGCIVGFIAFNIANKYVTGNMKLKKDDYAPF